MRLLAHHEAYVRGGSEHSLADIIRYWPHKSDTWTILLNAEHPSKAVYEPLGATVRLLPSGALSDAEKGEVAGRLVAEVAPDALILNNGGFPGGHWCYPLMEAARDSVSKRVMIVRNVSPTSSLAFAREMCSNNLHAIVAVADSVSNAIDASTIFPCRLLRIHNGIPRPVAGLSPRTRPIDQPLRCGMIARIEERKGHHVALAAAHQALREGIHISLMFAGEADGVYLQSLASGPDWNAVRPELRGFIQDRDILFSEIDVLLVPSIRQESCSRVVLEAAARGIPSIVSRCGGLPEIVDQGCGWVVNIASSDELQAAVAEASVESIRLERGAVARARYEKSHTVEAMAATYAGLICSVGL